MIELAPDGRRLLTLTRDLRRPDGRFGTFGKLDTGRIVRDILERPKPGLIDEHPSIPPTDRGFDMDWTVGVHPHHPECYELRVPGRTAILLHPANWFQELLGCLAPGMVIEDVVDLKGRWLGAPGVKQIGVAGSKEALEELIADLEKKPCRLIIKEILPQ